MGGWVDGWMGGWVDGWMGGWVDGWTDDGLCMMDQSMGGSVGGKAGVKPESTQKARSGL